MRPLHLWLATLLALGLTGCSEAKQSPTASVSITSTEPDPATTSVPATTNAPATTNVPATTSKPAKTSKPATQGLVTQQPTPADKPATETAQPSKTKRPAPPKPPAKSTSQRRVRRRPPARPARLAESAPQRRRKLGASNRRTRRASGAGDGLLGGLDERPKAEGRAAPPTLSGAVGGIGRVTIEPTQAKVGSRITVRAGSPFPEGARIKLDDRWVKATRSEDGRSLRFSVPAGATGGYVHVVVGNDQYASSAKLQID